MPKKTTSKRKTKKTKPKPKPKRRYKSDEAPAIDVTGLSIAQIEELLRTSGNRFRKKDLAALLARLNAAANKRLKNLEKTKKSERSFAYKKRRGKYKSGKKKGQERKGKAKRFKSPKKKTRHNYQKSITEVLKFLKSKSSTIKGVNEILKKLEEEIGHFDTDQQASEFFTKYHEMLEALGIARDPSDAVYMALRAVYFDLLQSDKNMSETEIMNRMDKIVERLYSESEEKLREMDRDKLRELAKDINDQISAEELADEWDVKIKEEEVRIFDDDVYDEDDDEEE